MVFAIVVSFNVTNCFAAAPHDNYFQLTKGHLDFVFGGGTIPHFCDGTAIWERTCAG